MDLLLIVGIPFAIALILSLPGLKIPKALQTWGIPAVLVVMFGLLLRHFPQIEEHGAYAPPPLPWIPELSLSFSFYLDGLSLLFGLVITGIGAVIFLYTGFYFEDEHKQTQFNVWMSAFAGAMLGVVLSGNLILMFIMWELTSVTSFMLIGFYGNKDEEARYSARRALIITGGGGLALLAGVILLGAAAGQTLQAEANSAFAPGAITGDANFDEQTREGDIQVPTEREDGTSTTFTFGDEDVLPFSFELTDILTLNTLTEHPWYLAIAILLMLGAFTKSAQFPFHFWLPGAMTAPTPASAFLHSATMVKAGIYLLARLHPLLYDHPLWINGLVAIGGITLFISAVFALKQRDLKGLLAYSTTSWLGVLVMLIGLPDFVGFKALAIGILAHALYKSALFLSVGSIDHATGTRVIDKLGGMWKYMPATGVVVILSALSMAGVPFLFGFLAKEVLLDATVSYMAPETFLGSAAIWVIAVSAALTGTAGYILIYDVFFAKEREHIHYHAMPRYTVAGPLLLAVGGTMILPFFTESLLHPLVGVFTPKEFELHLFPEGGLSNELFQISLLVIAAGLVVFALRRFITGDWQFLPFTGAQLYQRFLDAVQWSGDMLVRSQNGRIRYYLFYILGVIAIILTSSNVNLRLLPDSIRSLTLESFDTRSILNLMLLVLGVGASLFSVITKRHLIAALSVSVFGYSVAGIFIVEGAPDVALVQFLIETLSTVLIVMMIGRISHNQRKRIADSLWNSSRFGIFRDAFIAFGIGFSVFIFALTALANRGERTSIAQWHIENTEPLIAIPDVVAAIVTDFRGMDTFIEIAVFAVASLGVLSLLAVNRNAEGIDNPDLPPENYRQHIDISTPFAETIAYLVFPVALLVAIIHLLYGGEGPGDGFTAGVIAGLAIALGYVIFGYYEIRKRVRWLRPLTLLSYGLLLSIINAALPFLIGEAWLYHWSLKGFDFAGLHIASTTLFEMAIALTVFGSVGVIMESIAHPRDVEVLSGDELYDPNYGAPPAERPLDNQPAGAD